MRCNYGYIALTPSPCAPYLRGMVPSKLLTNTTNSPEVPAWRVGSGERGKLCLRYIIVACATLALRFIPIRYQLPQVFNRPSPLGREPPLVILRFSMLLATSSSYLKACPELPRCVIVPAGSQALSSTGGLPIFMALLIPVSSLIADLGARR